MQNNNVPSGVFSLPVVVFSCHIRFIKPKNVPTPA